MMTLIANSKLPSHQKVRMMGLEWNAGATQRDAIAAKNVADLEYGSAF
jgi:hypothetical protein